MKHAYLMTSASAVAMAAAAAGSAVAQDFSGPAFSLTVQGGNAALNNIWYDKLGASGGYSSGYYTYADKFGAPGDDMNFNGSIALNTGNFGYKLSFGNSGDNLREFGGAGSSYYYSAYYSGFYSGFSDDYTGSGYGFYTSTNSQFSYKAIDVDYGMNIGAGGMDAQAFVGARILRTDTQLDKTGAVASGYFSGGEPYYANYYGGYSSYDASFTGVGPRAGVSFSSRLGSPVSSAGAFGISGSLAGSLVFGRLTETVESGEFSGYYSAGYQYEYSGYGSSYTETSNQTAVTLEAQIGLDYYLNDNAKLTLGYQAQQFWNVDATADTSEEDTNPRLVHGAFIGFTTSF